MTFYTNQGAAWNSSTLYMQGYVQRFTTTSTIVRANGRILHKHQTSTLSEIMHQPINSLKCLKKTSNNACEHFYMSAF